MSPALARTSNAEILAAARDLLESGGVDAVTMQAVADRVGIKAPSLYKRYPSRAAVLTAIADDVAREMALALAPAVRDGDPDEWIRALANGFRTFAHRSPAAYLLLFSEPSTDPTPQVNSAAAAGLLGLTERVVGAEHALDAARLLTAFAHGFVTMELTGAFRLGGDVDRAFDYSIDTITRGLLA